jgi:hypothetical protein
MRMQSIDSPGRVALQTRSLARLAVLLAVIVAGEARAEESRGAQLPPGVEQVEEGRYRTGMSWDGVLKWYGKVYPRSRYDWIDVINRPGIRAVHIANGGKGGWDGINVYEHKGHVRIYVLERK